MTAKRPAVVMTSELDIWVGNTTDVACTLGPVELFGFSTGSFEEVVSRGSLDLKSYRFVIRNPLKSLEH